MKAYLTRDTEIIQIPEDFATLLEITPEGYFRYKIQYYIDPSKSVASKAITCDIQFSEKPFARRTTRSFLNLNPQDIIYNLMVRNSRQKDFMRGHKEEIFFSYRSDISKHFPNNLLPAFRNKDNKRPTVHRFQSVVATTVAELNEQNVAVPIMDTNLFSQEFHEVPNNVTYRRRSSSLLNLHNEDPASYVGQRSNTLIPARIGFSGIIPNHPTQTSGNEKLLIESLLTRTTIENQTQLNPTDVVNVTVETNLKHLIVEEIIDIPRGDIEVDDINVLFRLRNNKGMIVRTVSSAFNHSQQVALLTIPTEAPSLLASKVSNFGSNIISVKQMDPYGTAIRLYRKIIKDVSPNIDSTYRFVGEIEALASEDFKRIKDPITTTNPVLYRAISINNSGIMGAEFGSIVMQSKRGPVAPREPRDQRPIFLSISTTVEDGRIVVSVTDVPALVIAIEIMRYDRTIKERTATRVGDIIQTVNESASAYTFEDTNLKKGRIYEYLPKLYFKDGKTQIASVTNLTEYSPIQSNIVDVVYTAPEIIENGADIDVKFTITKNIIANETDVIKAFLEQQGFLGEFQDEIIANREKLGELFGVEVIRTNLSLGEVENFGIITSSEFSDVTFGRPKGVSPVEARFNYRYTLKTYARNIETLLPTLERTVKTGTNTSYTLKPSKWRHPVTLSEGNLVSDNSLKRNHSKTDFTFGTVVNVVDIEVSLADVLPSLYDGKAKVLGLDSVLLQWKVQGNVDKIDHFIVILEVLGIRTIVGKSHNITNSNYFQFVDKLTNDASGGFSYYIMPVFFDYSRGTELKTNQVVI